MATDVEPPPVEVFRAFETLDAGKTSFTQAQLEAVQTVLTESHRTSAWWELKRAQIEQLLHQITNCLDLEQAPCSAD